MKKHITQEELIKIIDYNPDTGIMTWKVANHYLHKIGNEIGTQHKNGYREVSIYGNRYYIHRLAWFYQYNEIPKNIDHINGITNDNRIDNLRNVEHRINIRNTKLSKNNTSGHNGIRWDKKYKKFESKIMVNYKKIFLGYYDILEDAINARKHAEIIYKFHKNHGR